jgi:hypothetical protein
MDLAIHMIFPIGKYYLYTYFLVKCALNNHAMKSRLNITIDEKLIKRVKVYAGKNKVSVSELVESYFRQLVKPAGRQSIIDVVEKMDVPEIPDEVDLVNEYHRDMEKKYGA